MVEKLRNPFAILAGIVVSVLVVAAVENLGHVIYPPPEGIDLSDPESLEAYISVLPVGAMLFVLSAWVLGTVLGGGVACFLAKGSPRVYARIIGGVMLTFSIINMIFIPHPIWFSILAVVLIVFAAVWVGSLDWWWRK